jgi:type VI secretion system secreted protein VgrG
VASIEKSVSVEAKTHVLMTAQGASLRLEGGNIELHCPGTVEFKATAKELAGPSKSKALLPLMPRSQGDAANQHFILKSHTGNPIPNRRYRASTGNRVIEGITDSAGASAILDGYLGQIARFELVEHIHDEHFVMKDPFGEPIANMPYKIRSENGVEVTGETDEEGRTIIFASDKVESIELLLNRVEVEADKGVG